MTASITRVLAIAAALCAACAAPAGKADSSASTAAAAAEPSVADVRAAIEAANQRTAAGMVASDLAAMVASYSDDAVTMLPGLPMMTGRAEIEAGMKGMLEMIKVNSATFTTTDVTVRGDLAVETGTFSMTTTMGGGAPMPDKGKYITVWKRQGDGSWKIFRDINNSDGPPPPPAK